MLGWTIIGVVVFMVVFAVGWLCGSTRTATAIYREWAAADERLLARAAKAELRADRLETILADSSEQLSKIVADLNSRIADSDIAASPTERA